MESNEIFEELNNAIRQLKQLQTKLLGANQEKASEIEKKESSLVIRIVGCFHEILLDNFIPNKKEQSKSPENKENNSYYWDFISKHFNTPVVFFCRMLEKGELNNNTINSINPYHQKGKSWIYFSILEKTFYDSINEIYKQGLDKIYSELERLKGVHGNNRKEGRDTSLSSLPRITKDMKRIDTKSIKKEQL